MTNILEVVSAVLFIAALVVIFSGLLWMATEVFASIPGLGMVMIGFVFLMGALAVSLMIHGGSKDNEQD